MRSNIMPFSDHYVIPVFPDAVIRVCQFHVIQALGRADLHHDDVDPGTEKVGVTKRKNRISVSKGARADIAVAFRRFQRYGGDDDPTTLNEYKERFREDIVALCDDHSIEAAVPSIMRYFERNWFCNRWRSELLPHLFEIIMSKPIEEHVTDEGLPPGQTRDGGWNTNNYIEASFRDFNRTFLEHRMNKRLVLITYIRPDTC